MNVESSLYDRGYNSIFGRFFLGSEILYTCRDHDRSQDWMMSTAHNLDDVFVHGIHYDMIFIFFKI